MMYACTLCGELCDVLPRVPLIIGKGVPGRFGLTIHRGKFCCADCGRRVAMLFATCNTPVTPPGLDDDDDLDEIDDDVEVFT